MLSKDKTFEVLADWNYWETSLPETVSRPGYEKEIARKAKTGEVIVLKGVRRSGKSTLLLNEMKRLVNIGHDPRNILYVNFEDPRFVNNLDVELMARIKESYLEFVNPKGKTFFFLDEVQNIPAWEKWVLKEYATKSASLYVTGSSSSLLSLEIGTALSGRYLDIEVFPLSFQEFLHFNKIDIVTKAERIKRKSALNRLFRSFMKQGGFPKLVEISDERTRQDLLKNCYDSILLRDIVARHKLTRFHVLEEISAFLLANSCSLSSTNKLKNVFGISFQKAQDYTAFMEEAYLIFQLHRFSWSLKKQFANLRKFYSVDTGLSNRVSFQVGSRQGQNLENIIFIELLRRGREIYFYKTKNEREVDFLVKEGRTIKELIQVSYSITDEQTRKREFSALKTASDELTKDSAIPCRVLTMDDRETVKWKGITIEVENVIDWLLKKVM